MRSRHPMYLSNLLFFSECIVVVKAGVAVEKARIYSKKKQEYIATKRREKKGKPFLSIMCKLPSFSVCFDFQLLIVTQCTDSLSEDPLVYLQVSYLSLSTSFTQGMDLPPVLLSSDSKVSAIEKPMIRHLCSKS